MDGFNFNFFLRAGADILQILRIVSPYFRWASWRLFTSLWGKQKAAFPVGRKRQTDPPARNQSQSGNIKL